VSIGGDFLDGSAILVGEPQAGLKNKCEEILMNWKTLLVIASLTLSAGLTACNKEAAAPDATKTDSAPAASEAPKGDAMKPADAPKSDAKPADGKGDAMKPADGKADAPKGDAMKPADTKGDKKPEAPKKP
jgi:hypothetical protein